MTPDMEVVLLNARQTLLAGSTLGISNDGPDGGQFSREFDDLDEIQKLLFE